MIDKTKCGWCGQQVQPGTEHEPAGACEDCTVKRLGSIPVGYRWNIEEDGAVTLKLTDRCCHFGIQTGDACPECGIKVLRNELGREVDAPTAPPTNNQDREDWGSIRRRALELGMPLGGWTPQQYRDFVAAHEPSTTKNNPGGGGSSAGVAPSVQYSAYGCNSRIPRVVLVDVDAVRLGNGSVNRPVADLVLLLERYCVLSGMYDGVVFISRMSEAYREETIKWLVKHNLYHGDLYMRAVGDKHKDYVVKEVLYMDHIKDLYSVSFVIDRDRESATTWRRLGLTCFQV